MHGGAHENEPELGLAGVHADGSRLRDGTGRGDRQAIEGSSVRSTDTGGRWDGGGSRARTIAEENGGPESHGKGHDTLAFTAQGASTYS